MDGVARRRKLLLMLNEVQRWVSWLLRVRYCLIGGYGLRAFLIAQSLHQIDKA